MKSYLFTMALGILTLSGCTTLPETLKGRMDQPVTEYAVVAKMTHANQGEEVRLGGMIVDVKNRESDSVVEIVALPTSQVGRPQINASSLGRFKAIFDGFVEPADYAQGRPITVLGDFQSRQTGKVDDYKYDYPVLKVKGHQLWNIDQQVVDDDRPYCYGLHCSRVRIGVGTGRVQSVITLP
ncbi:Slp family lipoprotein [Salinivibrio sp. ES.052]|uniref:Slp family lipoprotein n=1 Tax=Salinivibrio sp. ES.052 TaxID=1882823 RepID=UPI0009270904|nr:Slp family lipoprotein [Salinivibrio sp. ES.052]SIN93758.1 outer membrane lipoprotein [Salinivibrio sp. ES.052]